jgi:hypothetical protein
MKRLNAWAAVRNSRSSGSALIPDPRPALGTPVPAYEPDHGALLVKSRELVARPGDVPAVPASRVDAGRLGMSL